MDKDLKIYSNAYDFISEALSLGGLDNPKFYGGPAEKIVDGKKLTNIDNVGIDESKLNLDGVSSEVDIDEAKKGDTGNINVTFENEMEELKMLREYTESIINETGLDTVKNIKGVDWEVKKLVDSIISENETDDSPLMGNVMTESENVEDNDMLYETQESIQENHTISDLEKKLFELELETVKLRTEKKLLEAEMKKKGSLKNFSEDDIEYDDNGEDTKDGKKGSLKNFSEDDIESDVDTEEENEIDDNLKSKKRVKNFEPSTGDDVDDECEECGDTLSESELFDILFK